MKTAWMFALTSLLRRAKERLQTFVIESRCARWMQTQNSRNHAPALISFSEKKQPLRLCGGENSLHTNQKIATQNSQTIRQTQTKFHFYFPILGQLQIQFTVRSPVSEGNTLPYFSTSLYKYSPTTNLLALRETCGERLENLVTWSNIKYVFEKLFLL